MRRIVLAVIVFGAACSDTPRTAKTKLESSPRPSSVDLTGAGATFPYPLYARWISDYVAQTGVRINYQSVGSGSGIRQFSERLVDFGASDVPMTDEEVARMDGGILHIPTVAGALAIIYNVPGVPDGLRLDGSVLADIYMGRVKRWNSPRIAGLNPGLLLPPMDISAVHRSDASGATYVFTDFLSSTSSFWKATQGPATLVRWAVGEGEAGNEGVAGRVKQSAGAIGYVELAYARQNRLQVAGIKNFHGEFVLPSRASVVAAASSVILQKADSSDFRYSIVNATTPEAYPISSFSWILIYRNQRDPGKGKKLVDFLEWALSDGAAQAMALDYASLPEALAVQVRQRLKSVSMEGGSIGPKH